MRFLTFLLASIISVAAFAVDKDPCGVTFSTRYKFSLYDLNQDGTISSKDPKLSSRIEKVLKKSSYNIVKPEEATYVLSAIWGGGSVTKVYEYSLDFQKLNGESVLHESRFIDSWPVGIPEFVIRNQFVSWVRDIPECK